MRILITGATGLIGTELIRQCRRKGIAVHYLTRDRKKTGGDDRCRGFLWNPKQGEIDASCLSGVATIIHLAGAPVFRRWTKAYKTEIVKSRTESAGLVYDCISEGERPALKHFISISGVDIYKSGDTLRDESYGGRNGSFLADVTASWEAAADRFSALGMTVTKLRTGMVLDRKKGALPQLVKPVKFGLGAPLGSGRQWVSWIHVADLARLFLFVAENRLSGVYNAIAPHPVTNKTLTRAIARRLRRPLWLPPVPAFVLKPVLGERAALALANHRVSSRKIEEAGYRFGFPGIEGALKNLL